MRATVLILLACTLALVLTLNTEPKSSLLIASAAPACPKLTNPCDEIDCRRPRTKEIA
ncbi:MAG: hypothetical protein JWR80_9505 [Bradyrhizobium sp.]|nr:hypothetical protein [Bradyrhizobium sp.]